MKLIPGKLYKALAHSWGYYPSFCIEEGSFDHSLPTNQIVMHIRVDTETEPDGHTFYVHSFLCPDLKIRYLASNKEDGLFASEDDGAHLVEAKAP